MRLPIKFTPKASQHAGNAVGAAVVIAFGLTVMAGYLPDNTAAGKLSFAEWLEASGVKLPILALSSLVPLFGLGALTVALVNLFGGSPFNHLIVDRFGIRTRTFFGEKHVSWRELGPIRPLRRSPFRTLSLDRRFWIVSDTFSGEGRNDARRPLSTYNLRISVASYLGSAWLGGDVGPAMEATAAWLESLRKLAREDALDPNDVPDAPDALGPGVPLEKPGPKPTGAAEPELPPMQERQFGRRDQSTVER